MLIGDKASFIIDYFKNKEVIKTELVYKDQYQLLISVILSAQCTDKRINVITPRLFKVFPDYKSLASADEIDVYDIIKSVSYPKDKSERIVNVSKIIHDRYNDVIPNDFNELVKIKGIGRKTANLVLSILYDYAGIAVDTHVLRVSNRLGLVKSNNPDVVEKNLANIFSKEYFNKINPWFVIFGRYTCKAKNPSCIDCALKKICCYKNQ